MTTVNIQSILDTLPEAVAILDTRGRISEWNRRAVALFGFSSAEAVGEELARLISLTEESESARPLKSLLRSAASSPVTSFPGRAVRRDQHPLLLHVSLHPIETGAERAFMLTFRESRQAEGLFSRLFRKLGSATSSRELTAEEAIQGALNVLCQELDWASGHAWVPDRSGRLLVSSGLWHPLMETELHHSTRTMTVQAAEGFIGRAWDRHELLWTADVAEEPRLALAHSNGSGNGTAIIVMPVMLNDQVAAILEFFALRSIEPTAREVGALRNSAEYLARVLERCRGRDERDRLSAIIETFSDAVIRTLADGTIQSWNDGAARIYGYSAAEAIGQPMSMLLPEDDSQEEIEIREAMRSDRRLALFETVRRRRDGRRIDVSISITSILDAQRRVVGAFRIERDITRHKQRERDLERARQTAEDASRAKSEFFANISHELRTPMNAVIGMVELALGDQIPPLARDYLETAHDSSRVMLSLVNDLLDLARMESGRLELDDEPFRLRRIFEDALRGLSLRAHERGIELPCDIQPDVPDFLSGDARRLRQIVSNLVGNALKFTEQGEVVVRVEVEAVHEREIVLHGSVSDTGIGISPEDRERIFAPFTQADASTTRKHTGAGLGLTITRELVERMDGRIWVESTLGRGSTFHFVVKARRLPDTLAVDDSRVDELRRLPVLVVDDNATNRRILQEMLSGWAMEPVTVESAAAALERVREANRRGRPFPLIIVDALMPEVDGFTFVENLERDGLTSSATVLMLSSADRQTFDDRCRHLAIAAFLEKPISHSILLDAVMTALKGPPADQGQIQGIAPTRRPLMLLVVEDTPANQKVVRAILQKRGHDVQVAGNGREALEILKHEQFDLVLMDVQMPTMDGFQATAAIRALDDPRKSGIPIVAMTAHAMAGDRTRCLNAGMNGYISKPIDAAELIELIERFGRKEKPANKLTAGPTLPDMSRLPPGPATGPAAPAKKESGAGGGQPPIPAPARTSPPKTGTSKAGRGGKSSEGRKTTVQTIDIAVSLRRMGDDRGLLKEMATFFIRDTPQMLRDLSDALTRGESDEAARHAHSIKGLASNFDAFLVQELAEEIERVARAGNISQASSLVVDLPRRLKVVADALQTQVIDVS